VGIPLWLFSATLSTYYGAAVAGMATLGRVEEERDGTLQPPALTGFILRDASTAMAAWITGGFLCGLLSVLALDLVLQRFFSTLGAGWVLAIAALCDTLALVVGLLLWKRLAEARPHSYCVTAAAFALPIYLIVYPFRRPLGSALSRLYPPSARHATVLFTGEVKEMAQNGETSRMLDEDEREMIQRVFLLGETVVREIMVPRIDMVAIEETTSIGDVVDLVKRKRHSRIPVYRNNVDNMVGFLHIKDVIASVDRLHEMKLTDLVRPAYFIPETKRVDELLSEMRDRHMHLAIVVDEYGGTAGLATLEDVIEEVVGEIQDESDKEAPLVSALQDGSYRVDAKVDLDELNERLNVELPAGDYDTLGGYLYGLAGKIPAAGDRFVDSGLEFVIGGVRGKRITQVLVRPAQQSRVEGVGE
jgi:CBS domain containing-hemolysin-like protein